jgi:membrane associated rhomboid family serine protease
MIIPIGDDNSDRRSTPWLNYIFVISNVLVFVFLQGFGNDVEFTYAFSTVPAEIVSGQDIVTEDRVVADPLTGDRFRVPGLKRTPVPVYFTILTSMFMHGGLAHIVGNMLFLFIFGDNIEDRLGKARYLLFYLVCGVLASLAHVFTTVLLEGNTYVPSLGASGAISGVLGGYLVLFPRKRVRVLLFRLLTQMPAVYVIGIWFAFQLLNGIGLFGEGSQLGGVAYAAHIGGFVAGVILIKIFSSWR